MLQTTPRRKKRESVTDVLISALRLAHAGPPKTLGTAATFRQPRFANRYRKPRNFRFADDTVRNDHISA